MASCRAVFGVADVGFVALEAPEAIPAACAISAVSMPCLSRSTIHVVRGRCASGRGSPARGRCRAGH
jgi:hypothetical protein